VPYGAFVLNRLAPVIDRVGESRTNDELAAGLAARFGFRAGAGEAFDPDPDRLMAIALPRGAPAGPTQAPGGAVQFRDLWPDTHGRRARLVADEPARRAGVSPVPTYVELASELPLTLVTPANARTINSIFGDTDPPEALVRLHPDDAAEREVLDGQVVRMTDGRHHLDLMLAIDGDLRPGVASMPKGLWRRSVGGGLTANAFSPDTLNDLAGGACFNDARVEVSPIPDDGSLH
jgi:anaerobic selenocysteine-containing dehydrogenase